MSSASYRIVNLDLLSFLFSLICCECCEICGHKLDITEDRMGLAPTISLCCGSCGNNVSKSTSWDHELDATEDRRMGLATTFSFCCVSCGNNVLKSTFLRLMQVYNSVIVRWQVR